MVICSLNVLRLDGAPIQGVGARDLDRLHDFPEHDTTLVAAGDGAHVALVFVTELAMAGQTNHMPSGALYVTKL
jgi:hypothetical protein